jgi:two-component system, OmpR family, phosphate regulon response regulator PhoB
LGTILVVEDEQDLLEVIEVALLKDGHEVLGCFNTESVMKILDEEEIDLILMDRKLPDAEGSDFIESIKKQGYSFPVIYISGKDSTEDILDGFNKGADDYITKPFERDILRARVSAVLKRTKEESEFIKYKDFGYSVKKKRFYLKDKELDLTMLERDLLLEFIKNKNVLLTREMIIAAVWSEEKDIKPKTVNVAVKRLKEKIDPEGIKEYIQPVRGEGYIFS